MSSWHPPSVASTISTDDLMEFDDAKPSNDKLTPMMETKGVGNVLAPMLDTQSRIALASLNKWTNQKTKERALEPKLREIKDAWIRVKTWTKDVYEQVMRSPIRVYRLFVEEPDPYHEFPPWLTHLDVRYDTKCHKYQPDDEPIVQLPDSIVDLRLTAGEATMREQFHMYPMRLPASLRALRLHQMQSHLTIWIPTLWKDLELDELEIEGSLTHVETVMNMHNIRAKIVVLKPVNPTLRFDHQSPIAAHTLRLEISKDLRFFLLEYIWKGLSPNSRSGSELRTIELRHADHLHPDIYYPRTLDKYLQTCREAAPEVVTRFVIDDRVWTRVSHREPWVEVA
jgi:hypothetical protein